MGFILIQWGNCPRTDLDGVILTFSCSSLIVSCSLPAFYLTCFRWIYWYMYYFVVVLVESCPSGEIVLEIVVLVGNSWALFLSSGNCPRTDLDGVVLTFSCSRLMVSSSLSAFYLTCFRWIYWYVVALVESCPSGILSSRLWSWWAINGLYSYPMGIVLEAI